jgi:hypothetical protein
MYKKLRILFTVLCAVCLVPVVIVGVFAGIIPALIETGVAILFFVLAAFFKKKQFLQENPPRENADFLHPKKQEDEKDDTI